MKGDTENGNASLLLLVLRHRVRGVLEERVHQAFQLTHPDPPCQKHEPRWGRGGTKVNRATPKNIKGPHPGFL